MVSEQFYQRNTRRSQDLTKIEEGRFRLVLISKHFTNDEALERLRNMIAGWCEVW